MIKLLQRGVVAALIVVALLLHYNQAIAGIPVGTWRSHPAYNDATFSIYAWGRVYVLSDGALYYYEPSYNALYTIDKTGGLSDTDIKAISYCDSQNALVLVYSNGNIDILYNDNTIYNFTDLKNSIGGNANIHEIKSCGDKIFISADIGLIVFNIKKCVIENTYKFETAVNTSVIIGDSIICGTESGIYIGVTNNNLLDQTYWKMLRNIEFKQLFIFDGQLCGRSYDNRVWTIRGDNGALSNIMDYVTGVSIMNDNSIALIQDTVVTIYNTLSDYKSYIFSKSVNNIMQNNNEYWLSQGVNGLNRYSFVDNRLVCTMQDIKPNSPRRNWFHSVSWPNSETLLVVGGCHNYAGIDYPGTVMLYQKDKWSYLQDDLKQITGRKYINLTEAVVDPNDEKHIFVGSTGQGLYEFYDYKFKKLHTWDNSLLSSILDHHKYDYVRISALQYDTFGNLWMANNETDTILKILEPNGEWFSLFYPELSGIPTLKQLRFDNKGRIWLNSSRGIKPGIICIDLNDTPKNNKDDKIKYVHSWFINQDGTNEEIFDVFCYDFDLDGVMWIGTNRGIFVLKNPDNYINESYPIFERIKIPRNDGSGLADYLLNGVMTTALFIDQGNRKWIGTLNDGVFLVSPDGTETLEHFTTSNSPLPSNNILSITNDGRNGSLFFGTSLGMVEYGGDAREPEKSLSESNLMVYPNPVKPEYDGVVTITGLTENSTVRICSNSGQLLHQAISNGGSYSWNLTNTNTNGNPVSSGVYQVIVTNQDNSRSESISFTVIR